MRILFLSDNFPPEVNAPASRTFEHCREWVRLGAEVTVITCAPNFPIGRVYEGYRNRLYQTEWQDGIKVIRVWSYIAKNEGRVRRILDYLSFMLSALPAGLAQKTDIIVATSPQFFTTWAGGLLAGLKRRPWVFELRDLWPESIKAVSALPDSFLLRFLERIELGLYRRAKLVVALTDAFKDNLIDRGISAEKIAVVKNGVCPDTFMPRPPAAKLQTELKLEGKFVVGYIGTHGLAHGLDFILRCAAALSDQPAIHFLLIGAGAEKKRLQQLAQELSLSNLSFLPPQPKVKVPEYLSLLSAAVIPLRKTELFKTVLPSKIFESAAMEKPILLGVDGEARRLIEDFGAGLYFEPENQAAFLAALARLQQDPALYESCQQGCRRLAAAFSRPRLAQKLYALLEKITKEGEK